MSKNKSDFGIYASIDTLFDTRIGTLYQVLPELVDKVLDDGYYDRDRDEFLPITYQRFKFLYDNRDDETLEISPKTFIKDMITDLAFKQLRLKIGTPHVGGVKVTINVYPYNPSPEFTKNLLDSFVKATDGYINVEIVSLTDEQLTPQYCKHNFMAMFMYDCSNWLDIHSKSEAFKKCKIPNVTLLIPSIYFGNPLTEEIKKEYMEKQVSPFREFEIACSPFICVNVVDTDRFCPSIKLDSKNVEEKKETA